MVNPMDPAVAVAGFRARFAREPECVVSVPGRAVLLGEHVDYEGGSVLAFAIPQRTFVAVARREDVDVAFHSAAHGESVTATPDRLDPRAGPGWFRYVGGALAGWKRLGAPWFGLDAYGVGDVPIGRGLSSSASLVLALLEALEAASGIQLDTRDAARFVQDVEHEHAGVRCGLLDPLAIRTARAGQATLIDCQHATTTPVPWPPGPTPWIVDTGVPRDLAASAYNERVAQCRQAAQRISGVEPAPPLASLRADGATHDLAALDPVLARRARHVLTESARVHAARVALAAGDWTTVGDLVNASHRSLRDDFEVSGPELDALVAAAAPVAGVLGSRLVGAGFGGCTLHLVSPECSDRFQAAVTQAYQIATGRTPEFWPVSPSPGPLRHRRAD